MNDQNKLPVLQIRGLKISPPFILGGMGVRISEHKLAAAAANLGMAGTIASVGLCDRGTKRDEYAAASSEALRKEIRACRKLTKGVIGVNIMVALANYEELARTAAKEKVDYIVSGAGLPLELPEYVKGSEVALIPIVSSLRAAKIILKKWQNKFGRIPDAFIVEGALAGGHLGYTLQEISNWNDGSLVGICKDVIALCAAFEKESGKHIPVIAAGGIYDGKDIARILRAGVEGVQMATRFMATEECTVPANVKNALLHSRQEDIVVIKSPVGLPGRVLKNKFVEGILKGKKMPVSCSYHCLKTCEPETTLFCIAEALVNAYEGDLNNGIIMPGANAYRIKEVLPIGKLVSLLIEETLSCLRSK